MRTALILAALLLATVTPDPRKTTVETRTKGNAVLFRITLHDSRGNALGAGLGSHIDVVSDGVRYGHPEYAEQSGVYVAIVLFHDGKPPQVTISVDGVRVMDYPPPPKKR